MKNAKKWITFNNKIEKLDIEIYKYERGLKVDFIKLANLQEKRKKLYDEQFTFEVDNLTLEDKMYINDYYQCEMFEILS
jgi:hypothetical protein